MLTGPAGLSPPSQSIFAGTCVGIGGMLFTSVGASAPALAAANPGLGRLLSGAFGWPVAIILVRRSPASPSLLPPLRSLSLFPVLPSQPPSQDISFAGPIT